MTHDRRLFQSAGNILKHDELGLCERVVDPVARREYLIGNVKTFPSADSSAVTYQEPSFLEIGMGDVDVLADV